MARAPRPEFELFERGVLARLTDVDVGYDGPAILEAVEFEARAGAVAIVTGPTSAGKTTLMHLLRLALPPRNGEAIVLGELAHKMNGRARARLKRRIGYIAENPAFVEEWTGFENIALSLRLAGRRPRDFAHDVQELAEFVGLSAALGDEPVKQMSGAARRRVAIARALAGKPDLILADDPTAGMSPEAGRRIVRLLAEMRRVGAGVVITSQDETLLDAVEATHWRIERARLTLMAAPAHAEEAESFR